MFKNVVTGPQHEIPAKVDEQLALILCWPRPHGSEAELMFRSWLRAVLEKHGKVQTLPEGALYIEVGTKPTTMFSCHMDTVDSPKDGLLVEGQVQRKSLTYDPVFGLIGLDTGTQFGCLGADDGAGIWMMLQMLKAKVPGGYCFHAGEERGGISAYAILKERKDLLQQFTAAVAFDRPNTSEVIHTQGGQVCASLEYSNALAAALNANGMDMRESGRGVFTDTKVYRGVIVECINLGIGYANQHSPREEQDYAHLVALTAACIKLDWAALPIKRDPSEPKYPVYGGYPKRDSYPMFDYDGYPAQQKKSSKKKKSLFEMPHAEAVVWIMDNPAETAALLYKLRLENGRLQSDVNVLKQIAGVKE